MSSPRVLFVEGDGVSPSGLVPPRREDETPVAAVPHWTMWRLLSGNNRELGRSATTFVDLDEAIAAIHRLRAGLDRVAVGDVQETHPSKWSWLITLDDEPIARSTRGYQRLRECRYSLAGFLEGLPIAEIVTDPERVVRQRRPHEPAIELLASPNMVLR